MASTTPATSLPGYQVQASSSSYKSSGSIGPVFAVISVIVVLAALSCIFGKICASRMADSPDSSYDCLNLVRNTYQRSKCSLNRAREAKMSVSTEFDKRAKEGLQSSVTSSEP